MYTRLFLISLLFAFALGSALPSITYELSQFQRFVNKYNKVYAAGEFEQRFSNFKASLVRIAEKNAKSRNATYGINQFSDMSTEEFRTTILMKNPITPERKSADQVLTPKNVEVPASLDWRQHGAVTPVKNQEQCGSCWAFSTTENVESMWILAGKGSNSSVDFAPQQIVDCDTVDEGCDGGNPPTAYAYLIGAGGIESESSYPYTAEDGTCKFKKSEVVGKISSWKYATTEGDETTLQNNLISWGPLSICVDAEYWQDYTSGVLTWEECAYINELDHCVQLVGYNAEDSSNPYWIVRNSWGTSWGVEGYIWLQMWEDTCGLTYEASSSVV